MIVYVTRPGGRLIEARRAQRSFGDGFITAEIKDLQEPWMAHVDAMLADEGMVSESDSNLNPNERASV